MKQLMLASLLAVAASSALAADVGVSISIGDPNFYGQIDIGNFPRPQVIYAEPVIVQHVDVVREPIYLRVPPGHARHWERHCAEYRACGRPVYFVRDDWYSNVYAPRYRHHDYDGRRDYERRHDGERRYDHDHRDGPRRPDYGHGGREWQDQR